MSLLTVEQLTKTFEDGLQSVDVLKDISFKINRGEFASIMGESGSGKSTLLYNVSGMDKATSGHIILDDVKLHELNEDELADLRLHKMGFIFQQNYLLKNLSVKDNIILPGYKVGDKPRDEVRKYAKYLMNQVGIEELGERSIHKISGGQLQRASICRALINRPEILFADEPTGALNSMASLEVLDTLSELNKKGMTILMVTHDVKIASRTDRIIYLKDGLIKAELKLGKLINGEKVSEREQKTLQWLIKQGF